MSALVLDRAALSRVIEASGNRRASSAGGGGTSGVVTAEVIAECCGTSERCHCADEAWMSKFRLPGFGYLFPGMRVEDLHTLEGGCCQGKWICPSLDQLRRRYGQ